MQLGDRKKNILGDIVSLYITTGEPVGSKLLASVSRLGLSSATIRNEMSELVEMGYLEQPHTSAGRVPSELGYRMYVDSLMEHYRLTGEEKAGVDRLLAIESTSLESLLGKAGDLLASLTGYAAVSAPPLDEGVCVRSIEIVPAGRRLMLIMIIASTGVIKSRLCRVEENLNADMVAFFSRLINDRLRGATPSSLTDALAEEIAGELYEYTFALKPVIGVVFNEIRALSDTEVFLGGETNLLQHPGVDSARALKLIRFLEKREELARLMSNLGSGVRVRIGSEIGPATMNCSSMISSSYTIDGLKSGFVGIIGPTRMNYPRMKSYIEYFSLVLSRLIRETFFD